MNLAIYEAPDSIDQIETIWRGLEALARPPYQQSWGWIENWLATRDHAPSLAVIHDDAGAPIAAAFDDLPVLRAPACPALGLQGRDFHVVVEREDVVAHVDLETVRAVAGGYLATLPPVVRAHLHHAYRQLAELEIEVATDAPRAHQIFDELLDLRGSADDPLHRRLIDQRAPCGELQLLRVRAGDKTLGCFYDVSWHGRIAYQLAAFDTLGDAGLCHGAAIEHFAARGHAFYEVQPADLHLATGHTRRVVLRLQRRPARMKLAG